MQSNNRVKSAGLSIMKTLALARSEAIRTGSNHIAFFGADAQGANLFDANGNLVAMLVIDDQSPQNCQIDPGEIVSASTPILGIDWAGINWGVTAAINIVPTDAGDSPMGNGFTFTETGANGGTPASWVLFNSRGMASAFTPGCNIAGNASGGGGVYVTNGARDYAIVVNGLGSIESHAWNQTQASWSN
jgi:Tfp pilus assembly protein FimT